MKRWMGALMGVAALVVPGFARGGEGVTGRPNIVLILADDLGIGELGCYGQKVIRTPNIDALAREGMRFERAYSPSPVCAPTRCSLLTGLHLGHSYVRDNREVKPEGQIPIPASAVTIAERLKGAGYATACTGKWGLGPVGSSGDPLKQGFDFFYGHNCQRVAHNHYADHVWKNDQRVELEGNVEGNRVGKQYAPDLMADEAIGWLKEHQGEPFFLYFATPLPHVSLQAPEGAVAAYRGKVEEGKPFVKKAGDYVSCDEPHATYAAMVTRIDDYVGRIVATLKEMGVEDNTVVLFASDNGPTFNAGTDSGFFGSAQGRRGLKEEVYEGGIRVPLVVKWPGRVKAGSSSGFVTVLYDLFPTFEQMAGVSGGAGTDGVSLVPTLTGEGEQAAPPYRYWEIHMKGGRQALRKGDWKLVRTNMRRDPNAPYELYDLAKDPNETKDVAAENPEVVKELKGLMAGARTDSEVKGWNFEPVKGGAGAAE